MAFKVEKITNRILDDLKNYVKEYIEDRQLLIALIYNNFESSKPTHGIFISMDIENLAIDDTKKGILINEKQCPYCNKILSSKTNRDRHVKNYCLLSSIVENKYEHVLKTGIIKNIFPNLNLRDIIYIAGKQGSGKSTYVKNYMEDYIKIFLPFEGDEENHSVILFSKLKHDDVLDNPLIVRPGMEDILTNPIDVVEDMKGSLCIFDDYTSLEKEPKKEVERIITDAMEIGRDHHGNKDDDIYVCIVRHMLRDYKKTRDILFECSVITFFPHSGVQKQIIDVLKEYCGFNKKIIDRILNLPSRWVSVSVGYPSFVLYSGGVFIPK